MHVVVQRDVLAEDLWSYGEDDLWLRALEMSDLQLGRVAVLAGRRVSEGDPDAPKSGMLLAKACALAAVEVLEGRPRSLRRKRRRSRSRRTDFTSQAPSSGGPRPREVYLAAAAEVARHFERCGFRYLKSGPRLTRSHPPYLFDISFSSSHYNTVTDVTLRPWVGVRSPELKKWRLAQPTAFRPEFGDAVAGGYLSRIDPNLDWMDGEWNLAAGGVVEVVDALRETAIPYFALFADAHGLIGRLASSVVPSFGGVHAIEWLLWQDRRDVAIAHGRVFLAQDPLFRRRYERALERYRRNGPDERDYLVADDPNALAAASLIYDLPF